MKLTQGIQQAARLAIDRVFTVRGRGLVVTGTLRGGRVAAGDTLRLEPGGTTVRVREVQVHGRVVPVAGPGRAALALSGAALAISLVGVAQLVYCRCQRGFPLSNGLYAVMAAQLAWFVWGAFDPFFAALLVPALHSLQYLTLTSWHHLRAAPAGRKARLMVSYLVTLAVIGFWAAFESASSMGHLCIPTGGLSTGARLHCSGQDHQVRWLLSWPRRFAPGENGEWRADSWKPG